MIKINPKINEKVGIGIVSFRRYSQVSETCSKLKKMIKGSNIDVVVADDGSEFLQETHGIKLIRGDNQGVSVNKNRVLNEFKDYDYIFIIEDDVKVENLNFIKEFINFSKDTGVQAMFYGPIVDWPFWKVTSKGGGRIRYTTAKDMGGDLFYSTGSVTALTKKALQICGGLSARFQHLGLEHMEWAMRLCKMGLSDDKPQDYFMLDFSKSLSFYEVKRNLRRQEIVDNNVSVYYELIKNISVNSDYLDVDKLHLESRKFKIFGLGLSKTGTNSLNEALNLLGFKSIHYPVDLVTINQLVKNDLKLDILSDYDAITDITLIPFWEFYFKNCPDSKFILTTRDESSWINSIAYHWNVSHEFSPIGVNYEKLNPLTKILLKDVYKGFDWSISRFSKIKKCHENKMISFFKNHEERFLLMDIVGGDGWDKLCPFLKMESPKIDFPFLGKSN